MLYGLPYSAYALFLLTGICSGVSAGLFGVGGGLIIVPVLVAIFHFYGLPADIIAHLAIGTSLAVIVITSISSMSAHHKKGGVDWQIVKRMAGGLAIGSLFGAFIAKLFASATLTKMVGVGAILMAINMAFFAPKPLTDGSKKAPKTPYQYIYQYIAGLFIGILSALFGIGGGSLTVPFLLKNGLDIKRAVGTSAACGLPIALSGAIGFALFGQNKTSVVAGTVGFVHLAAFACIASMSFFGAKMGANLAHKLPSDQLKKAFAAMLVIVGIKMIL